MAFILRELLPGEVAGLVISTLKGSSAMARNAVALEQVLHQTKAAEHARAERRRRRNRAADVGGGTIYASELRGIGERRVVSEAVRQEAAVAVRKERALRQRLNAYKRL